MNQNNNIPSEFSHKGPCHEYQLVRKPLQVYLAQGKGTE